MPERFKVVCTMQGAIQVLSFTLPLVRVFLRRYRLQTKPGGSFRLHIRGSVNVSDHCYYCVVVLLTNGDCICFNGSKMTTVLCAF